MISNSAPRYPPKRIKKKSRDFPGGPVVKTQSFHCKGRKRGTPLSNPLIQLYGQKQTKNKQFTIFTDFFKKRLFNKQNTHQYPKPQLLHAVEQLSPQLLSLCSRAREAQRLKPMYLEAMLHKKRNHCNEKPKHHN